MNLLTPAAELIPTDPRLSFTGIDTSTFKAGRRLGSSWRHRRLVIGGTVWFDPVALARPSMRPDEIDLLTELLRQSTRVVEFGAGGSTALILKMGVSHLISIESDREWVERLRADPAVARAIDDGRLVLQHVDIGEIGMLGGPRGKEDRAKWPGYPKAPWDRLDLDYIDLVLIDGRFRVACVLETIMHVSDRTLIAIHDFWNRPAYHMVLPFLDEVCRCETLGVFRKKPGAEVILDRDLLTAAYDLPL